MRLVYPLPVKKVIPDNGQVLSLDDVLSVAKEGVFIANDRDQLPFGRQFGGQRTEGVLADQVRVTRVFRVHRDGGVPRNGFGSRGGDGKECADAADSVLCGTGFAPVSIFLF